LLKSALKFVMLYWQTVVFSRRIATEKIAIPRTAIVRGPNHPLCRLWRRLRKARRGGEWVRHGRRRQQRGGPQRSRASRALVASPTATLTTKAEVYNAIFNASISSQTCYDLNGNREAKNSANLGNFLSDNRIDTCTVRTVCVQYLNKTCPIALTPVPLAAGHVPPSIR
jgi:hypothetical protein